MAYDTALTIISDAATELGLGAVSDAYGSTDPNIQQLCGHLKSQGRALRQLRSWKNLQRAWVFQTTSNQGRYSLPADYGRFIPESAWNRTNRLPLQAITPQDFQALKARLVGVVYNILFRVLQGNFQAFPDTATQGGWIVAYEYTTNYWVTPKNTQATSGTWNNSTIYAGGTYLEAGGNIYQTPGGGASGLYAPSGTSGTITDGGISDWVYVSASGATAPTDNADTINFDSNLVSRALKLAWKKGKGFPSQAELDDFNQALAVAFDDDSQGKTLYVTGNSYREPLLSGRNFPLTGFGQ